jgi:hypothetical protein
MIMKDTSALTNLPKLHIKPFDGMSVTAEIWAQAHDEHRKNLQAHNLFFHGAGIVNGLEVVANDPPDQYVFISPGLAVDPAGNIIVLTEAVAYDFGNSMEGDLYLMLGHGEREVAGTQKDTRYMQSEFVVAARPSMPKRPAVELARVHVSHRGNAIKNAANPAHPGMEEIDMRFRPVVGVEERMLVRVAICHLGEEAPAAVLSGWDFLSKEVRRSTPYNLVIDNGLPISPGLSNYAITYIAGTGSFKVESGRVKELAAYLEQGKALIVEALDEAADESFKPLLGGLGVSLKPIAEYDSILKTPFLFNAPPEGNQGNRVLLGKRVIYSNARYALAWGGKVLGGTGSRSDIRSAHEWGINLIYFCAQLAP